MQLLTEIGARSPYPLLHPLQPHTRKTRLQVLHPPDLFSELVALVQITLPGERQDTCFSGGWPRTIWVASQPFWWEDIPETWGEIQLTPTAVVETLVWSYRTWCSRTISSFPTWLPKVANTAAQVAGVCFSLQLPLFTCGMAPSNLVLKAQGLVTSCLTTCLTVSHAAIKNVSRTYNRSQLSFQSIMQTMYNRLRNTLGICYPMTETAKEKKGLVKGNQKKKKKSFGVNFRDSNLPLK